MDQTGFWARRSRKLAGPQEFGGRRVWQEALFGCGEGRWVKKQGKRRDSPGCSSAAEDGVDSREK